MSIELSVFTFYAIIILLVSMLHLLGEFIFFPFIVILSWNMIGKMEAIQVKIICSLPLGKEEMLILARS